MEWPKQPMKNHFFLVSLNLLGLQLSFIYLLYQLYFQSEHRVAADERHHILQLRLRINPVDLRATFVASGEI